MAIYKLARFEVKPDSSEAAERVLHELASFVRAELPGSSFTAYRDGRAANRFITYVRSETEAADERYREAPGTRKFALALAPLLVGGIDATECQLVTSSDLAPRPKARGSARPRRR